MTVEKPAVFNYSTYLEAKEELDSYKASGLTPEQVAELAEKDRPMKPRAVVDEDDRTAYECGQCGADLEHVMWYTFCPHCGQRLGGWHGR